MSNVNILVKISIPDYVDIGNYVKSTYFRLCNSEIEIKCRVLRNLISKLEDLP